MADTLIPLATTDEKDISMVGGPVDLGTGYVPEEKTPVPAEPPPRSLANPPSREIQGNDLSEFPDDPMGEFPDDETADLRDTYRSVKDTDPVRNSEINRISKETGEDPAYVDEHYDEMKKTLGETPESKFDDIKKNSPKTAKWLEDANNMALVHDDLDQLPEIERLAAQRMHGQDYLSGDPSEKYAPKRYPDLEIGVNNALLMAARTPVGVYNGMMALTNIKLREKGLPQIETPKILYDNPLTRRLEEENQRLFKLTPNSKLSPFSLAGDTVSSLGNLEFGKALDSSAQFADTLWSQIIQNAPTQAALLASAMYGAPNAGLMFMGAGSAGQSYKENKDKGLDEAVSQLNATTKGAIEAVFENFGTLGLFKKTMNSIYRKFGEQTLKQVAKDFAKTMGVHFFGEGLVEEGLTSIAQDLTDYVTGVNPDALKGMVGRYVDSALVGGFSAVSMTAPSAAATGAARAQATQQVKKDLQTYKDMGDAVGRLKLTDINRPAIANLLEQATDGTDIKEVFVDPDKIDLLFQQETKGGQPASEENPHAIKATNPVEFAAEMGILKEYEEAKSTGTKIKIPYAKFLEKLVKTNYYSALENDITFDAKKASANELAEDQKRADELEKQAAEAETPEQKRAAEVAAGLDAHKKARTQELVKAGRSVTEARLLAETEVQYIQRRAGDMGKDPLEMAKNVAPIQAVSDVPGGALEQGQDLSQPEPHVLLQMDEDDSKNVIDASDRFSQEAKQKAKDAAAYPELMEHLGSVRELSQHELKLISIEVDELREANDLSDENRDGDILDANNARLDFLVKVVEQSQEILKRNEDGTPNGVLFNKKEGNKPLEQKWEIRKNDGGPGYEVFKDGKYESQFDIKKNAVEYVKEQKMFEKQTPSERLLTKFKNRFGFSSKNTAMNKVDREAIAAIDRAQNPKKGPYVADKKIPGTGWAPNYAAEPTGTIGVPGISTPNIYQGSKNKHIDPFTWADMKYEATKKLITKHTEGNVPLVIHTSSDLVGADYYIELMAPGTVVNMYLLPVEHGTGFSDNVARQLFPGNPSRKRQISAAQNLKAKGIEVNLIEPTAEDIVKASSAKNVAALLGVKPTEVIAALNKWMEPKHGLRLVKGDKLFQKDNLPAVVQQPTLSPLGFFSQVEVEVQKMDFKSMPAKDLLGRIENIQGIKKEELEWMGLREWLEAVTADSQKPAEKFWGVYDVTGGTPTLLSSHVSEEFAAQEADYNSNRPGTDRKFEIKEYTQQNDGKVTKEEVIDFIKNNGVKVEQVVLSEDFNSAKVPRLIGDLPLYEELSWNDGVVVPPSRDWIHDEANSIMNESDMSDAGDHNYFGSAWGEKTLEFLPDILETLDLEYEKDEDGNPLLEIEWAKPKREGQPWTSYSHFPVDIGGVKFAPDEKEALLRKIESKLDSKLDSEFRDKAEELAESNYYNSGMAEYKYTERETSYDLVGNDESGEYYCPDNGEHYSGNITEAQLELSDWLLENGKIETQEQRDERHAEQGDDDGGTPVAGQRYTLPIGPQPPPDVNSPSGKTSYDNYVIEGGTNYRELILKLPSGQKGGDFDKSHHSQDNILAFVRVTDAKSESGGKKLVIQEVQSDWNKFQWLNGVKDDAKVAALAAPLEGIKKQEFEVQGQSNNAAAEVQKIWLQNGHDPETTLGEILEFINRENENDFLTAPNVRDDQQLQAAAKEFRRLSSEHHRLMLERHKVEQEVMIEENKQYRSVPDGPFIRNDNWISLAVKRILRLAVEQGYESIAWFPADVHTERWGTSNISWQKKEGGGFEIVNKDSGTRGEKTFETAGQAENYINETFVKRGEQLKWEVKELGAHWLVASTEQSGGNFNGMNLEEEARNRGLLLERRGVRVTTKDELIELLKKTSRDDEYSPALADSIWKQMQEGDSGSKEPRREFYENLYNKKVLKAFEAALKKLDKNAKVEKIRMGDIADASAFEGNPTPYQVTLTPDLKAAVQKGLPLFQQESTITRGFYDRMKKVIGLLPAANWSTALHELSHSWFAEMGEDIAELRARDASTLTDKQRQLIKDGDTLLAWLGAASFAEVTDEQQEKFARAMEAYFAEGKAPSKELRSAFKRFSEWLTKLGRTFKDMGIEMSPEVSDVFGRLLATQEQMDAARAEMNETNDVGTFGAKGEKAGAILQAWSAARDAADDEFHAEVIADMKRQASATYREQKEKVEAEVIAEVNNEPVYKAIAYLTKGTDPEGKPLEPGIQKLKLSKKILNQMFKPAQLEKLPRGISHKDGVHPDLVAQMLGFRNGSEMVLQMVAAEKKADLITRLTDERMKQRFPGLLDTPEVSEKALEALHNDKKARLLRLQLEALAEHALPKLMEAGKMLIRRVPSDEQVRTQARNTINGKKMADIRPIIYQRAEVKASRMAADAYAKGDIPLAFEHKRNEIYNHQLYLEAKKVQKFQERAEKLFDKVSKADEKLAKSYNMDMVNAARAVLATYGIGDETASPESFLQVMAQNDKDTYEVISALVGYATQNAKNLDDMTYEEYEGLFQSVNSLWELARESRKFTTMEEALELEVVREAIVASLSEYTKKNAGRMNRTPTDKDKRNIGFLGALASIRRVEHWADSIGGRNSAVSKYFVKPVIDAITQYRLKRSEVNKRLIEILKPFKGEANSNVPIVANELNEGFQFENVGRLMGAILHTGNDSNIFKMLRGESSKANPEGWGGVDAEGNLDRSKWQAFMKRMYSEKVIEKRHMDAIQAIWDLFEEIKPFVQKAHKQMYGHYFSEITANELVTPFGVYRGGYMPAIADPLRSTDAAKRHDTDDHFENAGSQMPQINRGMTKQRLNNYATPLHMDLRMVPNHMDKALKLAFIGPAYKQANRLMNDNQIREALNAYDPAIFDSMIKPWLERIVSQMAVTPAKTAGGRFFDKLWIAARTRTGLQLMPGNIPNIMEQFFGIVVANAKVDAKYLSGSFFHFRKNPEGYGNWIRSKSDWMKTKSDESTFELNTQLQALNGATGKGWEWAQIATKHAYIGQIVMQAYVDNTVWGGAYNQAVAEGRTEKQSIADADKAVRLTQGTFNVEDISNFETGPAFIRMFTQFGTYFNMVLNLSWTQFQQIHNDFGITSGPGSVKALMLFSAVFWIPSVLSLVLKKAWAGDLGADEDGDGENIDDYLWMLFTAPRDAVLASIPVAGPALKLVLVNFWNDKHYDDKLASAPAQSIGESLKAFKSVPKALANQDESAQEKLNRTAISDASTLLGLLTGLPLRPVGKAVNYGIKKAGESE